MNEKLIHDADEALMTLKKEKRKIITSKEYRAGVAIYRFFDTIKTFNIKRLKYYWNRNKISKRQRPLNKPNMVFTTWDNKIETNGKIAVYTCITGNYDQPIEPLFATDSLDFYIVTDMDITKSSRWKKIDVNSFDEIAQLNNVEKSRYAKLCPHKVFPQYEYSIYLDANFRVVADIGKYIKCVGKLPFASNWHPERNSIYDEAEACIIAGRGDPMIIRKQMQAYRDEGMPDNFGLVHCNMLIRRHNDERLKKVMDDWWSEFLKWSKRDQLSFPYVLWKNGYTMKNIGFIGVNVEENPSVELLVHNNAEWKH